MHIANPIYDTVFKYMMSDSKVAKALLSAIIGEKIVDLDLSSTEYVLKKNISKKKLNRTLEQLTVCRFDFAAKIETENGKYKTVIIELQKSKLATDIMRFRRYLGEMYQSPENTSNEERTQARQIYCIYFLNYEVGLSENPIIKVDYTAEDLATGEELPNKSEFIESLNHKSWIVQVRRLKEKRRNELENLLSIFDQSNLTNDQHILTIDESLFPEKYRIIIRKLREAHESVEVRKQMIIEDELLSELVRRDEIIAKKEKEIEEKDQELTKQSQELTKKDQELTKQSKEIEELHRQIKELQTGKKL